MITANASEFISLLRRARKSGYTSMVIHNRMIMQCYNIAIDSDMGLHYILHVPDDTIGDIYNSTLILPLTMINDLYREGNKVLLAKKKESKIPPKEIREEVYFNSDTHELVFNHIAQDEVVSTNRMKMLYPVVDHPMVRNIVDTYQSMLERIKVGGNALTIDGVASGYYMMAMTSDTYMPRYHKIKIGKTKIKIPIHKGILMGATKIDEYFISIQETELPDVYLYTTHIGKDGVIEQHIGYLLNF